MVLKWVFEWYLNGVRSVLFQMVSELKSLDGVTSGLFKRCQK